MLRIPGRTSLTSTGGQLWPVLVMLVLAVVVPTVCVLWFLGQAMQNEEAAVRLRLTEAYQSQLQSVALNLQQHWRLQEDALARQGQGLGPSERFAALVQRDLCDGAVILGADGKPAYPQTDLPSSTRPAGARPAAWAEATRAEFELEDPLRAAQLFEGMARRTADAHLAAQAWQGAARSRLKAGDTQGALHILTDVLGGPGHRTSRDEQGRLIGPNALLLALEEMPERSAPRFLETAARLEARLADYTPPTLSSAQRQFLWAELERLWPDRPQLKVRAAEQLAAEFLAEGRLPAAGGGLAPSGLAGVWALPAADGTFVALLREARITRDLAGQLRRQSASGEITFEVRPPHAAGVPDAGARDFVRRLEAPLAGWNLALRLQGPDPFATAARRQNTLHTWIAGLVIATIALLTAWAGAAVGRQIRSTRLKNDLIATVSHELKTPLSSMRVLVDTLREGHLEPEQAREYLDLIAAENQRLSGLIDNFLTFSRMERNKHVFELSRVPIADVVERAVAALGERLRAPFCRFEVNVERELPAVAADRDALVTVLLNLLDNALKYSGADRRVVLRAYVQGRQVVLEVEDNGVGFSRRVARRVFERFFQADRAVAGSAAGVGLGLSIVKHIVSAHHGTIDVSSQPGKGSRFTVSIPAYSK
jgi:signal transduction histidine kinase